MAAPAPPKKRHATKASARKHVQSEYSSDGRSNATTSNQSSDHDSDVFQRRPQLTGRPLLTAKRSARKKVKFAIDSDGDDDDDNDTVRAEPSQRRVQSNMAAKVALPRSPPSPTVVRTQQGGNKKARKTHGTTLDSNKSHNISVKSARIVEHRYRRKMIRHWGSKISRENVRNYVRMSIGSASRNRSSQNASSSQQDRRRRWFIRVGNTGARRMRRAHNRKSESESEQDSYEVPAQTIAKTIHYSQAIIKSAPRPRQHSLHESDIENEPGVHDPFQGNDLALDAPADEYLTDASENDEDVLEHTEPSQPLLDALEQLSLSVVRLQKTRRLPFLSRNLRRGFQLYCQVVGVETEPLPLPHPAISVVYNRSLTEGASGETGKIRAATAKSSMKDWLCPLCDLHKKFDNPKMLEKHLEWDHSTVEVLWNDRHTKLSLTIPDFQPEYDPIIARQASIREMSTSSLSSELRPAERSKSADTVQKYLVRNSSTPDGATSGSASRSVSTLPTSVEENIKRKYDAPDPYPGSVVTDARTRSSSTASRRSVSQVLSGTDARDGLGPSAIPPYLPETDERGDVYYSCRPGGPRLYDILNTLPLKPFGVLKWLVIDREEELFELDDILDEDKVMQALWFRWILLNRNRFVANYCEGTKAFIGDNWELIKQGAGLLALRTWLLVLAVNKFLLPGEVVTLMRYYQELANIQLRS